MDAYVLGGGEDLAQAAAARRLHGRAGDGLRQAIADDTPVLAVCGSLQLLGHVYLNGAGQAVPGLGLLDLETAAVGPRCVGEVVARLPDGTLLSGFENHAGRSRLGPQAAPLATVLRGNGNNGSDGGEGARRGNLLATYLHGPVLVRNPALADALCAAVLARRGHPGPLAPLDPDPATALHLERLRASEPRRGDGLRRPRRRRRQPRG
jgi:CobQ-like glutamine amidotransferase family enzyme